ncbi:hypothetical protein [Flavobacterium sp. TBRC 19031]|uniref:hypothetical protein n=1 Tax=Flavobacterium mekongense TaxID=3379707 RepID=UPI00399BA87C
MVDNDQQQGYDKNSPSPKTEGKSFVFTIGSNLGRFIKKIPSKKQDEELEAVVATLSSEFNKVLYENYFEYFKKACRKYSHDAYSYSLEIIPFNLGVVVQVRTVNLGEETIIISDTQDSLKGALGTIKIPDDFRENVDDLLLKSSISFKDTEFCLFGRGLLMFKGKESHFWTEKVARADIEDIKKLRQMYYAKLAGKIDKNNGPKQT